MSLNQIHSYNILHPYTVYDCMIYMASYSASLLALLVILSLFVYLSETRQTLCSIQHGNRLYNLSALKRPEIQGYQIPSDKYRFRLNVCGAITSTANESFKEEATCYMTDWESKQEWICGREESKLNIRDEFLELIYEKGDSCFTEMHVPRTVRILLICEPDMPKDTVGSPVFISENRCTYIMAWKTWAACPVNIQDYDPETSIDSSVSEWIILLVIIIVSVSVYFVLSIVYKTYVLREEGLDRIPNIQFWRSLYTQISNFVNRQHIRLSREIPESDVGYEEISATRTDANDT